jgi:hypothetical protein
MCSNFHNCLSHSYLLSCITQLLGRPLTPEFWAHTQLTSTRSKGTHLLLKDWLGDQRGGSEWEPIKILLKELGLCLNRNSKSHTLARTNRQDNVVMDQLQVLGTIPRSTHGSTRKEAKGPIKLGKFLHTDRTVRLAATNCPSRRGGPSGRTWADCPQYKSPFQTKNTSLCKQSAKRSAKGSWTVCQPRTVCQARADGPWKNYSENSELARTPPQSRPRIS